ncbi:tetratricopeptide repeat protein [Cerasicoccus frondis]|uniref:tetratricopeptide repeat protein n=1 Tax=Cerasicoccus frondis TaxID=490090 RepID=UPI00285277C1|nr:tetratricopeptide repeat protein [Cerasicoccus frondis]
MCLALLVVGCSGDSRFEGTAEEQVDKGIQYLSIFNFEEGYHLLSHAQPLLTPDQDKWALATYSLGVATWHKAPPTGESLKQAEALFRQVVETKPESAYAASALLDLGRLAEVSDYIDDPADVDSARGYYEQVRSQFPGTEWSTRATLYLAQSKAQTFERDQVEEAVASLEAEIGRDPTGPWVGILSQYLAQLYAFYLDDPANGLQAYERAVRAGLPRPVDEDMSLWQFALLAEDAGEYQLAVELYRRIVHDFPRSIYGTVAEQRADKLVSEHPEIDRVFPDLSDAEALR